MILCISCDCGGAEPLIRGVLREAGRKDWLTKSIYRGRGNSMAALNHVFGDQYDTIEGLKGYIHESSSYAVIIGANEQKAIWSDIGRGDIKSHMDALAIIDAFAE